MKLIRCIYCRQLGHCRNSDSNLIRVYMYICKTTHTHTHTHTCVYCTCTCMAWIILVFKASVHWTLTGVSDTWKKALESRSVGDAHPVVTTGAIHTAAVTGAQPTMAASAQSAAPASSSSPTAPTSAQATATPSSVRQATATPSSVRKRQTTPTVPVESSGDMSDGEEVQTSGEGEQGRGKQPGDPPRATVVAQDDEVMLGSVWEFGDGRRVGGVCIRSRVCLLCVFVLCVCVCVCFVCVCVLCVCLHFVILVHCNTFVCSFNVSVTFQCAS